MEDLVLTIFVCKNNLKNVIHRKIIVDKKHFRVTELIFRTILLINKISYSRNLLKYPLFVDTKQHMI